MSVQVLEGLNIPITPSMMGTGTGSRRLGKLRFPVLPQGFPLLCFSEMDTNIKANRFIVFIVPL